MRSSHQRRRWLVETDVTVRADAQHLQIDTPRVSDLLLVAQALGLRIGSGAVQKMAIPGLDVHVTEQVLLHEASIAARVIRRDSKELIEIEGCHLRKIHTVAVQGHQFTIEAYRR